MSVATQASSDQIAGRIWAAHNRRECRHCQRALPEGGVLAFGLSGSDARWYPDEAAARRATPGVRIVFPVRPDDVVYAGVLAWLEGQRDALELAAEAVAREREERRVRRQMRRDSMGFVTAEWPCDSCGWRKYRPADRCERCGDEPVPLGITPQDYNRARGYAA